MRGRGSRARRRRESGGAPVGGDYKSRRRASGTCPSGARSRLAPARRRPGAARAWNPAQRTAASWATWVRAGAGVARRRRATRAPGWVARALLAREVGLGGSGSRCRQPSASDAALHPLRPPFSSWVAHPRGSRAGWRLQVAVSVASAGPPSRGEERASGRHPLT